MTETYLCPCCGQDLPPSLSLGKKTVAQFIEHMPVVGKERLILELLCKNFGISVARAEIINFLYGDDPGGGPDNAWNTVAVAVSKLRKKIAPHGLQIDGAPWRGSRLRLRDAENKRSAA